MKNLMKTMTVPGAGRDPTADEIPGGIDAEREDEPGEADRKPINGRRLHGCTSFPEMERPSIVT